MTTLSLAISKSFFDRLTRFRERMKTISTDQFASFFVWSAGALLALTGFAYVIESFDKAQPLSMVDPVFGFSFRSVILFFGLLELGVAGFCLFTTRRMLSLCLILWIVVQWMVYRIGLWQMGWPHPYALTCIVTKGLSVSPKTADVISGVLAAFLLTGSVGMLLNLRRAKLAERFLKAACPACGIRIRFDARNMGQNVTCPNCKEGVTLRKPGDHLKMSCYFCHGHVEFPAHAIGERLKCPHCNMDITLRQQGSR